MLNFRVGFGRSLGQAERSGLHAYFGMRRYLLNNINVSNRLLNSSYHLIRPCSWTCFKM